MNILILRFQSAVEKVVVRGYSVAELDNNLIIFQNCAELSKTFIYLSVLWLSLIFFIFKQRPQNVVDSKSVKQAGTNRKSKTRTFLNDEKIVDQYC